MVCWEDYWPWVFGTAYANTLTNWLNWIIDMYLCENAIVNFHLCLIRYVRTCWRCSRLVFPTLVRRHEERKLFSLESLWGARCIFSNCVRDLAVTLRFVCVVLSRSAAPQKDRRSFAFLPRLVNMTLSSGAEKGVQSMSHLTGMSLTFSGWREQEES